MTRTEDKALTEPTPKEYLTRYRDAVREAREIELKITQLRLRYGAPGAINYSDMPKAHNNRDLSDYMAKLDSLTDLLLAKYEKCLAAMVDIEMRLDRLDAGASTQIEREVLRHRYTDITDTVSISLFLHIPYLPTHGADTVIAVN